MRERGRIGRESAFAAGCGNGHCHFIGRGKAYRLASIVAGRGNDENSGSASILDTCAQNLIRLAVGQAQVDEIAFVGAGGVQRL